MTADVATQIKNDNAVNVGTVDVGVSVRNVSVGEDKAKTLRHKKVLRMSRTTREMSDTIYRRTIQYRHTAARSKAPNVKPRTSGR